MEYRTRRFVIVLFAAVLFAGCAHRPSSKEMAPEPAQPRELPYAGLVVAEGNETGALVLDVIAGPAALAGVLPGDRIVSVDGEAVDGPRFLQLLRSSQPGRGMLLRMIRDGSPVEKEMTVGGLETWSSPSRYASRITPASFESRATPEWVDDLEARIDVVAPGLQSVKAGIGRMLQAVASDPVGYNRLDVGRRVLADPGALIALDRSLASRFDKPAPLRETVPAFCELLAVQCPGPVTIPADVSLAGLAASISDATAKVRAALPADRERMSDELKILLQSTAARRTLLDRPNALPALRAMRYSLNVDASRLLDAFGHLLENALQAPRDIPASRRKVPAMLAAMVQGDIVDFVEVDGGYVVVGGRGPNTYRMDRLAAVIDLGGDDRYVWSDAMPLPAQAIVDYAGNDRYEAAHGGPGAGWLGVAVLLDYAGDDAYSTTLAGCGAGAYGFGLLYDASGNDTYRCDAWSAGAGIYGGGMLIDGAGNDVYVSEILSQGVGGPAGVGVVVDKAGNDLYRANGPVPSAYDTPGEYMSFSQGVGFGVRPYDHGGFGGLFDLAGDDRYEGGEFSQGGGYFHGVGVLHDGSGNDLYYGSRYSQGFGCHQAAGLLTDVSGDDTYWSTTAAAQGAAWDQSVGMLFDGAGNDTYRAGAISQGAAAQQSRAWLYDVSGDDTYRATPPAIQGAAGANDYHFREDGPVVSLGVLVDGAGADRYSSGPADGQARVRYEPGNTGKGEGNAGVAIDE